MYLIPNFLKINITTYIFKFFVFFLLLTNYETFLFNVLGNLSSSFFKINMLSYPFQFPYDLFNSLLKALDSNTKLILSGDPYQLPPVGPGAPFRDLINSSVVPCYELMEIHRQAADSRIISTAHSVLDGDYESVYWDGERKDFQIIQTQDGAFNEAKKL